MGNVRPTGDIILAEDGLRLFLKGDDLMGEIALLGGLLLRRVDVEPLIKPTRGGGVDCVLTIDISTHHWLLRKGQVPSLLWSVLPA